MSISEFNNSSNHHTLRHVSRRRRRDPIQHPGRHIQRARTANTTECADPFPHRRRVDTSVFAPHTFHEPLAPAPPTIDGIVEIKEPPPDSVGLSLTEGLAAAPRRIMTRTIRARQRRRERIEKCGPVGIGRRGERSEPMEYKPHGRPPDPRLHNRHSIEQPCGRPPHGHTGRRRRPYSTWTGPTSTSGSSYSCASASSTITHLCCRTEEIRQPPTERMSINNSRHLLTVVNTAWLYPITNIIAALGVSQLPPQIVAPTTADLSQIAEDIYTSTVTSLPPQGYNLRTGLLLEDLGRTLAFQTPDGSIFLRWSLVRLLTDQTSMAGAGAAPAGTVGFIPTFVAPGNVVGAQYDPVRVVRVG